MSFYVLFLSVWFIFMWNYSRNCKQPNFVVKWMKSMDGGPHSGDKGNHFCYYENYYLTGVFFSDVFFLKGQTMIFASKQKKRDISQSHLLLKFMSKTILLLLLMIFYTFNLRFSWSFFCEFLDFNLSIWFDELALHYFLRHIPKSSARSRNNNNFLITMVSVFFMVFNVVVMVFIVMWCTDVEWNDFLYWCWDFFNNREFHFFVDWERLQSFRRIINR